MENYKSAMYQQDVMDEFSRQASVSFYGPGFKGFDPSLSIEKVIKKIGGADILIVGHSWLTDTSGSQVDPYPNLYLESCPIPKVMILNKEYANLEAKLSWISEKNFSYGFSHHHDVDFLEKKTKVFFKFIPLAFNENLFKKISNFNKDIDFAFSGLLKNNINNTGQTNTRILVMKKLFHCVGDIPIIKKAKFKNKIFFWNSIPRNDFMRHAVTLLKKYNFLSNQDYMKLQLRSKTFLNTLSPFGYVSTRYFENIASKTLVFSEESKNVKRVFPPETYLEFKSDFSDFDEKFEMATGDGNERLKIVNMAFEIAFTQHTWKVRISSMINAINSHVK